MGEFKFVKWLNVNLFHVYEKQISDRCVFSFECLWKQIRFRWIEMQADIILCCRFCKKEKENVTQPENCRDNMGTWNVPSYGSKQISTSDTDHTYHGVMAKAMDYGVIVSEFELQSRYYVHYWKNTLRKGMNLLILPGMG